MSYGPSSLENCKIEKAIARNGMRTGQRVTAAALHVVCV
jgi:hypothetical protein